MGTSDNPDKEVMKSRIEETLSRILSRKHRLKIKVEFKPADEHKKNKK